MAKEISTKFRKSKFFGRKKTYTIKVTSERRQGCNNISLLHKGKIDEDMSKMVINHLLPNMKRFHII